MVGHLKKAIIVATLFFLSATSYAGLQTASYQLIEDLLDQLQPIQTEVDYREEEYVEFPLGRNDNIKVGQFFAIYSQETSRYIGLVEIIRVRPIDSEAKILEERVSIQPGDLAIEDKDIIDGNIAVIGFLNHDGHETLFSRSQHSFLENDLRRLSGFTVIERRQMDRHLEQAKLTYQGFVEKGPEAGKLLGADFVVMGEYTETFANVILNARINETETGHILASASVVLPLTRDVEAMLKEVYKALIEDIKYSLTITAEGSGSVLPFIGSQLYTDATVVDVNAIPASGWVFVEWVGQVVDSRSSMTKVTMDGNRSIQAVFKKKDYSISGTIRDSEGRGIPDVMVSFSNGYSSVTTSSSGAWSKSGLSGGLLVTPQKEGYSFHPTNRTLTDSSSSVDFVGSVLTYSISGRIEDTRGLGIEGVSISFSGGYSRVVSGFNGYWQKDGLSGTVTITPSKEGYTFYPISRQVTGFSGEVNYKGEVIVKESLPGDRVSHTAGSVGFFMRLAPASTFPTGTDDSGSATVNKDFWIAETQVTYELWYTVRQWALNNGYVFANAGREGSHGSTGRAPSGRRNEPVTMVSWYDSIVWCNALSQMLGYNPVYTRNGVVIKTATGIEHTDVVAEDRNGFRLPTSMEWELAARYKGRDSSHGAIEYPVGSGNYWTPGNYASGATADYNNGAATQAAGWYGAWGGSGNTTKTQDVGQKPPRGNGLGLFDMSGNVWEWCFTQSGFSRVVRGGSWGDNAYFLLVGYVVGSRPGYVFNYRGLRFLRRHF